MSELCSYQITVRGRLDPRWAASFEGMSVSSAGGDETTLTGLIADQAALYGILLKLQHLGLTLTLVRRLAEPGNHTQPADSPT